METGRIHVLDAETSKRIAAGEVIDRPASALRELLDNALDAGATDIRVELEGGGVDRLRVADDGSGMGKDDLALSVLPHATSKIRELDDLLSLSTLGFRGEALASMAAVARLEIVSAVADDEAWRLESDPGKPALISPWRGSRGTAITMTNLFASYPARRKFLKRASAEASSCRAALVDKALAFPSVSFTLSSGGRSLLALRPSGLLERVQRGAGIDEPPEFLRELRASGPGFTARIIAGTPSAYRTDKRQLQVFVNGRRVQEYGIAQALEYSYRGSLPGGAWPIAYAFVEVDPELADFNIHPAKKEVRLKNLDDIRHGLITAIKDYLGASARLSLATARLDADGRADGLFPDSGRVDGGASVVAERTGTWDSARYPAAAAEDEARSWSAMADAVARARAAPVPEAVDALRDHDAPRVELRPRTDAGPRYLGQALGTFLVFEDGDGLVILDQHAAHERLLYEGIMAGRAVAQDLLVPVVYDSESDDEDAYIAEHAGVLAQAGFTLTKEGSSWLLESAPAMLPAAMTGSIFETLKKRPDPAELLRETAATAACRAAVKDGDSLDETAARAIYAGARKLEDPRCPHGRPLWLRLSREDLFRAVRRIV